MTTCPSCGRENAPHHRFCQGCGTAIPPPGTEEPLSEAGPGREPVSSLPSDADLYAGFWIRALALIIDGLIIFTGILILGFGTFGSGVLLGIVVPWVYESLMVASTNQATLGKMALGLEVVDENGGRLSFTHATGRHFAKYLSGIPLFAGYIIAAFTERKQALHDLIVKTYVVRNYR